MLERTSSEVKKTIVISEMRRGALPKKNQKYLIHLILKLLHATIKI